MIVPILTYNGTIKLFFTKTQLEKLGSIERRERKYWIGNKHTPMLALDKIMKRKACMTVRKCLGNDICSNFCGYFQVNDHDKDTRNKAILARLPRVKLEFNRQSFRFVVSPHRFVVFN